MKKLALILTLLCFGLAFGQLAEAPQYEFSSTSSHKYTEYQPQHTIPVSEIQQPFYKPNNQYVGVRKSPDYPPADPDWHESPVGDPPLMLFTILLLGYACYDILVKPALNKE